MHTYNGKDERINYFIKILKQADNRVGMLEERGVDIGNIVQNYVKELFDEDTRKRLQDILYNRTYSVLVPNVYFYDMLMKHMSNEVEAFINQYAGIPFLDDIEEEMYEIVIDDLNYVISICNSISLRPSDIKLPAEISNSIETVDYEEWVRLAYYERWYNKRERHKDNYGENFDSSLIISGVGFEGVKDVVPFLGLKRYYQIFDENYETYLIGSISDVPLIITSDIKIYEDIYLTFKSNVYLGFRGDILNALGLELLDRGDGIIGVDRTGKVILKYSRWEVCFDDINTGSYRVPYLTGAELKIRGSAFKQICKLFHTNPKRYTVKIH